MIFVKDDKSEGTDRRKLHQLMSRAEKHDARD